MPDAGEVVAWISQILLGILPFIFLIASAIWFFRDEHHCHGCGTVVPKDAPGGLCSKCVVDGPPQKGKKRMELPHCPTCDAPLPADAPQGLCPKCLLGGRLDGHHVNFGLDSD